MSGNKRYYSLDCAWTALRLRRSEYFRHSLRPAGIYCQIRSRSGWSDTPGRRQYSWSGRNGSGFKQRSPGYRWNYRQPGKDEHRTVVYDRRWWNPDSGRTNCRYDLRARTEDRRGRSPQNHRQWYLHGFPFIWLWHGSWRGHPGNYQRQQWSRRVSQRYRADQTHGQAFRVHCRNSRSGSAGCQFCAHSGNRFRPWRAFGFVECAWKTPGGKKTCGDGRCRRRRSEVFWGWKEWTGCLRKHQTQGYRVILQRCHRILLCRQGNWCFHQIYRSQLHDPQSPGQCQRSRIL